MTELALQYQTTKTLYIDIMVLSYVAYFLMSTDCLLSLIKMVAWLATPCLVKVYLLIGTYHMKDMNVSQKYYTFVLRSTVLTFCCSLVTLVSCLLLCLFWLLDQDNLRLRQLCIGLILGVYLLAFLLVLRRWREIHAAT